MRGEWTKEENRILEVHVTLSTFFNKSGGWDVWMKVGMVKRRRKEYNVNFSLDNTGTILWIDRKGISR